MTDFVHLHVHTEFSLLDGACRISGLADRLKEVGQDSVAITDHGVMYGVIDFYRACKEAGIKPIIGCEVYVAPRTRFDKEHSQRDDSPNHLVLLCENETGYQNLIYMVSMGFVEGFYKRPRIDMDLLREHTEGLICLSACLAGRIPELLSQDNYEGAKKTALEFQELFGDRYYLEVQDHGIPQQKQVARGILKLHQETGIPLVATNDAHYLRREDARLQDVLLCIQTGATVQEENRMRFETQEFYLKSGDEMAALFEEYPGAVENTRKIAEKCNLDFTFGEYHLPTFPLPEGETDSYEYLKKLCNQGFEKRYPQGNTENRRQMEFELEMIRQMGFVDYFLIVGDFIAYAKNQGIPVGPGRGSAAGSMVSYCLEITDLDPMKYGLIFERFLNPERITMPDIDIDFCYVRRPEVIDYVTRKYGADHVVQIVTFGTMAARAAVRDVGRALGMAYAEVDVVAKLVPTALHMTLDQALELAPQLRELYDGDFQVKELLDTARSLEGMPRHASTHAAGVVITGKPVYEYVPLAKNDESVVTQFGMITLEELGLLKMDFLGLRNLTVIDDAEKLIRRREPEFNIHTIPEDDGATYEMLTAGKTVGVFQLESTGMTSVCVGLKPQSIEDITAVVALFRPGPMDSIPRFIDSKHHPEHVTFKHPRLHDILDVTYGCIVYQEQVLEILKQLGGFSLGQADMVRRAMSKKKMAEILKNRDKFIYGSEEEHIPGAIKNGIPEATAASIYDEIIDFANYAFNKAHAVCYALVAYQTAYLKCHYPREYMAALLTSVLDNAGKVSGYIGECRELGIPVLPPDVNESDDSFTVSGENIRFGLVAVKNVGRGMIQQLMRERAENGRFRSFQDFCERMYGAELNRRALESLIKCGAFDSFGAGRAPLMAVCEVILDAIAEDRRKNLEGQFNLFGGQEESRQVPLPQVPEYPPRELIAMEKETLGLYLSGHPMGEYQREVKAVGAVPMGAILASFQGEEGGPYHDGDRVVLAGVVTSFKRKTTKNNSVMAYVSLEDDSGSMEMLVFSNVLNQAGEALQEDSAVAVRGRISARDDRDPQLMCDEVRPLAGIREGERVFGYRPQEPKRDSAVKKGKKLYVKVPQEEGRPAAKTRALMTMFPGDTATVLYCADTGKRQLTYCTLDERLLGELRQLLGPESVVLK